MCNIPFHDIFLASKIKCFPDNLFNNSTASELYSAVHTVLQYSCNITNQNKPTHNTQCPVFHKGKRIMSFDAESTYWDNVEDKENAYRK